MRKRRRWPAILGIVLFAAAMVLITEGGARMATEPSNPQAEAERENPAEWVNRDGLNASMP